MTQVEASEMTVEELQALLKEKTEKQRKEREKARKAYESGRDMEIQDLMSEASYLTERLEAFKKKCHERMDTQAVKLAEYGELRSNSKGGFTIKHSKGNLAITRIRSTNPYWDERSAKAVELIKDFLYDTVKKRDVKTFEMLMSFLAKNKNGDMEYSKVFILIQHEQMWDDKRWQEGIRLLKESYSVNLRGYGYEFKSLDEQGKWENLKLNFTAL
ncbi:DUF3164 family protein [Cyclobacterium marinum]|uniref:DUF3164 family protein n=1 Tax=Cyclobacterium marinum (strain ATCC 25205 / DSM 745 / LMG 13164 / NCIMB 1802) TaxID=880070 RepID=G0IXZ7_CYCMS|nr:DUF3164 family protein [Cyclobacterium marinum]AEL24330.1 hypothetical protein Cycma_0555 [Cyclobacterium marinum DSM 745]